MNERNLNEGQWEDRKQWNLGVGQRRKHFETDICVCVCARVRVCVCVFIRVLNIEFHGNPTNRCRADDACRWRDRRTDRHDGGNMGAFRDYAKPLNSLATFFFLCIRYAMFSVRWEPGI
jgi:hypothetical protein